MTFMKNGVNVAVCPEGGLKGLIGDFPKVHGKDGTDIVRTGEIGIHMDDLFC